jgi:hypothetical protein
LEQEEQVAVFLRLLIVGKETFLEICLAFQVARNLILLRAGQQVGGG